MSIVKFKISLTRCKECGLYNSNSNFLDLERSLQAKCKFKLYLGQLRNEKNIDQYRQRVHENKKYEKTSILIRFDLPEIIINKYGLQEKDNKEGKKLFQNKYIFTTGQTLKRTFVKNGKISNRNTEINSSQSALAEDLKKTLIKKGIDTTTKDALVNARFGQGKFRSQVLRLWNNRCSVTGSTTIDAIRASHIKPWRCSTDEERLDPYNGLSLVANLDALFDAGLISFESSGALIVSPSLLEKERNIFQVELRTLSKAPNEATAEYLAYHRKYVFRK